MTIILELFQRCVLQVMSIKFKVKEGKEESKVQSKSLYILFWTILVYLHG
ncbi:hypothetical protein KN1_28730 [Stygiolobus caldivivus]|uniref:Uncharacterized protein n=1 Tax=Stygiolobus caldivivus TaxID=2824673 RepID=A0A8D5U8I3_9CREN|nr:hypothetical protein KN1_28730 [Stygiolobus caldivivus]